MDHCSNLLDSKCTSRRHVKALYSCIIPPIDGLEVSGFAFAREQIDAIQSEMFFSQRKVRHHFGNPEQIKELLQCECSDCKESRTCYSDITKGIDSLTTEISREDKEGPLILAFLIYLKKLHFIYHWPNLRIEPRTLRGVVFALIGSEETDRHLETSENISLFEDRCKKALEMFEPTILEFQTGTYPSAKRHKSTARFPYYPTEPIPRGSSGVLQKFQIHEEYCEDSIKEHIKEYPGSTIGQGSDRKFLFASKSVASKSVASKSMKSTDEEEILRRISKVSRHHHIYFISPYIETNLETLLLSPKDARVRKGDSLPDNWLWKEMVEVAKALKTIHTGIDEGNPSQFIASHFDLKPANILITSEPDPKLKNTDFGESYIELVNGDDKSETFYGHGDPRYAPLEYLLITGEATGSNKEEVLTKLKDEGKHSTLTGQLNYDVWSLACIMTEVLVYIFNSPGPVDERSSVEKFRMALTSSSPKIGFFSEQDSAMRLKPCVATVIDSFQQHELLQDDSAQQQHVAKVAGPWRSQDSLTEEPSSHANRGALDKFNVFSLIVNKMIGTGILTSPASVFLMSGNKGLTLGLFVVGFAYTVVRNKLTVDEVASSVIRSGPPSRFRKLHGDGLLAYIIYAIAFVLFFNSGTNGLQLGRMILACITAKDKDDSKPPDDIHRDLMRFIAIFFLSLICLLQYFSPSFGRSLNKTTAVAKILMLLGILATAIYGAVHADKPGKWNKFYEIDPDHPQSNSDKGVSFAKALLSVIFSFQGWEDATFVTGEIPKNRHDVLRHGFIIAVVTVGCLYLAITTAFLQFFTDDDRESRRAWAAIAAVSSFGNINAIIYTFSRVKQAIGQANILPWSRFWKQDDALQRDEGMGEGDRNSVPDSFKKSPQGGLIFHWIFSVVLILATIGIHNTTEAVSFPGYIQTYIHCAVLAFLGAGFFNLKSREVALWPTTPFNRHSKRNNSTWYAIRVIVILYIMANLAILIVTVIRPYKATDGVSLNAVPGWDFPAIIGPVILGGTAYYIFFFGAAPRIYRRVAVDADTLRYMGRAETEQQKVTITQAGILQPQSWLNLMRWGGVQCESRKSDTYDRKLERVYRFGRRWRVIYYLPGDPVHSGTREEPGHNSPSRIQARRLSNVSMFLYWLFGGTRLNPKWWKKQEQQPANNETRGTETGSMAT
ncbi:hypothetical protein NW762_007660 [Fusarium torreyae]|uniref:Protein kinase domain-containing protein n=1 Tax=Fusarium torreyae TaxID=1237075 RepID=A0A9W8VG50_9HYPO|nr:hypothetical protein NW762_007660 [Fusarium torreyae]